MDVEYGFASTPSTRVMFVEAQNLLKWATMDFHDKFREVMDTNLLRDENIDALEQHEIFNYVNQLRELGLVCTR